MNDSQPEKATSDMERIISLVEEALRECDNHNLIFPAMDLAAALDKLRALHMGSQNT